MTGRSRVVLVGRAGCHLCDEARAVVAEVCGVLDVGWVEVNVDATDDLPPIYSEQVPVVLVDGAELAHYRIHPAVLRRALV